MNDENQILDDMPGEPAAMATESIDTEISDVTVPMETVLETTEYYIPDVSEDWEQLAPVTEPDETVDETVAETSDDIDYTPIVAESTSVLANVILCGALIITGALLGVRVWR